MSTSTISKGPSSIGPGPAPAPWRALFLSHLSKLDSPEFVLSTLSHAAAGAPIPFVPRARYCIYRGMFGEIPYSAHYDVATYGKNEAIYESDMLTFATDGRMAKASQISLASSDGNSDGAPRQSPKPSPGSGGGGPVEAVFWIKDVMTQWRFSGDAYMLGPDVDDDSQNSKQVKRTLMENMRATQRSSTRWSWQQEINSHFGNLSPAMRGSFLNPPPGRPVGMPLPVPMPLASVPVPVPAPSPARLGQKITGSLQADENAIARGNFRVVVIRVWEVERLDLGEQRRWRWRRGSDRETDSDSDREGERETGRERGCGRDSDSEGNSNRKEVSDSEGNREKRGVSDSDCEKETQNVGLRERDSERVSEREIVGSSRDADASNDADVDADAVGDRIREWVMEELWP